MKKVSSIMSKVIGDFGPTISIFVIIKMQWNNIVCSELKDVTSFHEAKYIGKNELCVTIKILSSAVLLAKYKEESIIENIKNFTGISKIKLVFRHVNSIIKEIRSQMLISNDAEKKIHTIENIFENNSLKIALESLKTEMENAA